MICSGIPREAAYSSRYGDRMSVIISTRLESGSRSLCFLSSASPAVSAIGKEDGWFFDMVKTYNWWDAALRQRHVLYVLLRTSWGVMR